MLNTAYPSEPLLSCAAARLLYPVRDPASDKFFETIGQALVRLEVAVVEHTIDKGLAGELVSRLVFLIGKDVAIRASHVTPASEASTDPSLVSEELLDCKPLSVIQYLTVLFGEDAFRGKDLHSFDGWYINFSHWIGLDENIGFTRGNNEAEMKAWLLFHWKRTSALQCHHAQNAIDKVIPMYKLRQPSEPREGPNRDWVSFILVQDKNKNRRASTSDVDNVNPQKAGLSELGHPYIAILADHGIPERKTEADFYPERNALVLHASGFGLLTYPFLKGTVAHQIKNLLGVSQLGDQDNATKDLEEQVRVGRSLKISPELLE
ncbi:hypothetical protein FRC08_018675 [Ceratobasidium sp. 394]|nr:hypothetical protein FRC08_018675 [Ceratobasidium sp. 394]KAG9097771.1 hypothetical protein FS749_005550 [Ceratobasidium sp. UAMH 11750]